MYLLSKGLNLDLTNSASLQNQIASGNSVSTNRVIVESPQPLIDLVFWGCHVYAGIPIGTSSLLNLYIWLLQFSHFVFKLRYCSIFSLTHSFLFYPTNFFDLTMAFFPPNIPISFKTNLSFLSCTVPLSLVFCCFLVFPIRMFYLFHLFKHNLKKKSFFLIICLEFHLTHSC